MTRFIALLFALASAAAQAQSYPDKPIRIIVGYAAGGGNDIIVRVMQPEMQKGLGQAVVVENKPGAQSIIAAELAARAAPDGYTIFMGPSGPMTINPATYSKLPYSPQKDFVPISMICEFPLLVTVDAKLPIRSVKELIAYAKANPGKSNYASSAGIFQITTELFKQRTATKIEMIPYKSSGESVQAVASGQVMMTIVDPPPATGALKSGTLRGLAIALRGRGIVPTLQGLLRRLQLSLGRQRRGRLFRANAARGRAGCDKPRRADGDTEGGGTANADWHGTVTITEARRGLCCRVRSPRISRLSSPGSGCLSSSSASTTVPLPSRYANVWCSSLHGSPTP